MGTGYNLPAPRLLEHLWVLPAGGHCTLLQTTRQWWTTTLSSRKEEHTAVVVIGSRQHPDDLYHHLLDSDNFTSIVETAHRLDCDLPEHTPEEHVDCVLWPTKRSFDWLMSRARSASSTGGRQIFEMVYYNQTYVEGTQIFTMNIIVIIITNLTTTIICGMSNYCELEIVGAHRVCYHHAQKLYTFI